jgi:hypothetical protein
MGRRGWSYPQNCQVNCALTAFAASQLHTAGALRPFLLVYLYASWSSAVIITTSIILGAGLVTTVRCDLNESEGSDPPIPIGSALPGLPVTGIIDNYYASLMVRVRSLSLDYRHKKELRTIITNEHLDDPYPLD